MQVTKEVVPSFEIVEEKIKDIDGAVIIFRVFYIPESLSKGNYAPGTITLVFLPITPIAGLLGSLVGLIISDTRRITKRVQKTES